MNIVLNDLESDNASARNIVLDDLIYPPYTEANKAEFYWRFEDEPTSKFQFLGQQTAGFPLSVPFDPQGREVRVSMIGVSAAGVRSVTDAREGVQTTFTPPSQADNIVVYDGNVVTYNGEVVTYG